MTLILLTCFVHAKQLTGNRIQEYGEHKSVQYKDFASTKYRTEQIRFVILLDVDYIVIDNTLKLNEYTMYGFNLYGLYFCLFTEFDRKTLFDKNIAEGVFPTNLYHNVGSEISEIYDIMYIIKDYNHLVFYDGDKYIFEIFF